MYSFTLCIQDHALTYAPYVFTSYLLSCHAYTLCHNNICSIWTNKLNLIRLMLVVLTGWVMPSWVMSEVVIVRVGIVRVGNVRVGLSGWGLSWNPDDYALTLTQRFKPKQSDFAKSGGSSGGFNASFSGCSGPSDLVSIRASTSGALWDFMVGHKSVMVHRVPEQVVQYSVSGGGRKKWFFCHCKMLLVHCDLNYLIASYMNIWCLTVGIR